MALWPCVSTLSRRGRAVCRRVAQAAIRLAEGDGLLTIQERRHRAEKTSRTWSGSSAGNGCSGSGGGGRSAPRRCSGSIGCKRFTTDRGDPQRQVVDTEPKKGCRKAAVDLDRSDRMRIRAGGGAGPSYAVGARGRMV